MNIKDDIGAGDGFAGGFVGYIYQHLFTAGSESSEISVRNEEEDKKICLSSSIIRNAVEEGIYVARQVLKHTGCQYF